MINLLIQVNGVDKPGVTSAILSALPQSVMLIEISQAVVQNNLSLSLIIEVSKEKQGAVLMGLLIAAKEVGVSLDFEILDEVQRDESIHHRLVCTVLCESLAGPEFGKLASCFANADYNIKDINMLSSHQERKVIEVIGEGNEKNKEVLRKSLFGLFRDSLNIAVQTDDAFRRNKRVVLLDMDSTLVDGEFIDELASAYGVSDKVSKVTASAMQGKLDYRASLEERIKLLKGMKKDDALKVVQNIKLNPGAEHLITTLKKLGLKVGIISGGFDLLSSKLQEQLQLDYAFSNRLIFDSNNQISGQIEEPLVDREHKATVLKTVQAAEKIRRNQIVAVGDGANDLDMLAAAGLGIAFHAKPVVQSQAKVRLNSFNLDSILYLMGLSDFEIKRIN